MELSQKEQLVQAMHRFSRLHSWSPTACNISKGEFFMLHKISHIMRNADQEKPGAKITDLSVAAEMSKPAVSQMLNSLEDKGLIERVMTKSDRRVVYVKITDAGKEELLKSTKWIDDTMEKIVEELGKEDTAELVRIFTKLRSIMEKTKERGQ